MNRTFKLENIEEVAHDFWDFVHISGKRVFGFSGDLGAGKTTFTKKLLEKLGHTGSVPSPTFVLRRDYTVDDRKVIHIDAYRLESPENLYQVVSKEELEDKNNIVIIEWPEKVNGEIFDYIFKFEHVDEDTRKLSIFDAKLN